MSEERDDLPKLAACSLCNQEFPSKTKLFRHLVENHGFENRDKPFKAVILLGWLSDQKVDHDIWLNDHLQISPTEVDATSVFVENAFFAAYNRLENPEASSPCYDRPKGYSRGTGIAQRTALLFSTEPTCHGLCDTFCFQLKSWGNHYQGGQEGWIRKMNELLPPTIHILHAYTLSSSAGSNFHAEMDCSQRRFEYLIPLKSIMPMELVKPPEETITRRNRHRVDSTLKSTLDDNSLMDQSFPLETIEGQTRVSFFRKLKDILKKLGGKNRKKFHNFTTAGAEPADNNISHRVDRIFHKEIFTVEDENWVVFSISGDTLLRGQVRKLLGLAIAVALEFLPIEYIDVALDATRIVELPTVPGFTLYLAECRYCLWEAKYTDYRLDPRRTDLGMTSTMAEWNRVVQQHIVKNGRDLFLDDWIGRFQVSCQEIYARYLQVTNRMNRSLSYLQCEFEEKFKFPLEVEGRDSTISTVPCVEAKDSDMETKAEEKESNLSQNPSVNARIENVQEFIQRIEELKFMRIPVGKDDVPSAYLEVLTLLRQADRSKSWPASSTGRQMVIDGSSLLENGGRGGSFSVGAFPNPLPQPKGNIYFPELMIACFKLERLLCPHRPPSSTIAINRHAQFLPHRDTGAGSGQKVSLIVALGMFTGGEIVVNHQVHDIRYKPLEFDGWQHLHYTLPFYGERYSLVWFTPHGITNDDLWWWKE